MTADSGQTNYRLLLAYDGSRYHGWQMQPTAVTVEGALRTALYQITGERPSVQAAGRTDAGAHAHGQELTVALTSRWSPMLLARACNSRLPGDIRVLQASGAPAGFHPRFSAWRRTYRYLLAGAGSSPVGQGYFWRVGQQLELGPMREAALFLIGRHDFAAFGRSPRPEGTTIRTVDRLTLEQTASVVTVEVRADAFLRGMMRNIVGALVAVGRGLVAADDLGAALDRPDSAHYPWPSAPAHGLHQWRVEYPASCLGAASA